MSSLRPSTHNQLYPLARTDPVQSRKALYLPHKTHKPEHLGTKDQKSPKIRKISTLKSSYFDISQKPLVQTWINLVSENPLSSRSDPSYNRPIRTSSRYQKLSLNLTQVHLRKTVIKFSKMPRSLQVFALQRFSSRETDLQILKQFGEL